MVSHALLYLEMGVMRDPDVVFVLPGPPRGKGRPRSRIVHTRAGSQFIAVYTDAETRSYEAMLRFAGQEAMRAAGYKAPFDCPLRVHVTSIFPIPQSWSDKKQAQAEGGRIRPTVKPDWENLAKTLDGVNGVVWRDDSLIVDGVVRKFYGFTPMLKVEVWRLDEKTKQLTMEFAHA
jgi:Holliday junction resolvase RusA-like endonuclease